MYLKNLEENMPKIFYEDIGEVTRSMNSQDCLICLQPFTNVIYCRVTLCFHIFH